MTGDGRTPSAEVLAAARALFDPNPDWVFLDTATFGLPPRPTIECLAEVSRDWLRGDVDWTRLDSETEHARDDFAALIGVPPDEVALIPSISIGVGMIAASLPAAAEVLVPADEYSSVILPLLVAADRRGIHVREVPFDALAEAVRPGTHLVAVSSVQLHTGCAPDLVALADRCEAVGARLLLDASQGVPFGDLSAVIGRVDFLVSATYKHLLGPRGCAFLVVRRSRWDEIAAFNANWRAADEEVGATWLGGPLRLRATAARFDTALSLPAWVGTTESLRLLRQWQAEGLFAEVLRLTRRLASGLGLPAPAASLVCLPVADPGGAMAALEHAHVRGAMRLGRVRLAPHVWTTDDDVDRAIEALRPFRGEIPRA